MKNQKFNWKLDIGHSLIRYRYKNRYTQQYIANEFDISLAAYKKWEKKTDNFNVIQLKKIAELYHIPVEFIIIDSYVVS
jgi:transcriptional regulator with XRE-family HTH domain